MATTAKHFDVVWSISTAKFVGQDSVNIQGASILFLRDAATLTGKPSHHSRLDLEPGLAVQATVRFLCLAPPDTLDSKAVSTSGGTTPVPTFFESAYRRLIFFAATVATP